LYRDYASLIGQPDQLGYGSRPHLLHDSTPMDLDRLLADAKVSGYVLVQPPGDDASEDLSLPRSRASPFRTDTSSSMMDTRADARVIGLRRRWAE
jgi:hypothetical protein